MESKIFGSTVAKIQKGKNIPINNLLRCGISKSQYFRFVKGESSLRIENFTKLIDQLNVTMNEFLYIAREYKEDPYIRYFHQIQSAFYTNNGRALLLLSKKATKDYRNTQIDKFQHISALSEILKARLEQMPIPKSALNNIKNYILSLDMWSHYDLCLFTNIMFAFKISEIRFLTQRIAKDTNKFANFHANIGLHFRLIFNIMIMNIEQNNKIELLKTIKELVAINLPERFTLEHILQTYALYLKKLLNGKNVMDKLRTIQLDLDKYKLKSYARMIKNMNHFLAVNYLKTS